MDKNLKFKLNIQQFADGDEPATSVEILNKIRSVAGTDYQERIPEATRENIASVGNTILTYRPTLNRFFTELINRIGRVTIERMDSVDDIYSAFKEDKLEFGSIVQKIFIDIPKAKAFEGADTLEPESMLKVEKGIIHVEYTQVDRKFFYKKTISIPELKEAFLTVAKLDEFIRGITESMATALSYDKYIMVTETLCKHCKYALEMKEQSDNKDLVKTLNLPSSVVVYNAETKAYEWDTIGAKVFLKLIRVLTGNLKFPHKIAYDSFDSDGEIEGINGVISAQNTKREKQILALEVSTFAEIDVDALATLFNLEKAELQTRLIELEDGAFGDYTSKGGVRYHLMGFVANKDAVERGKSFEDTDSFKNPEHEYVNMWQHYWGYMAVSKFKDFVPIACSLKATESEGE